MACIRVCIAVTILLGNSWFACSALAQEPTTRLQVSPERIHLQGVRDRQSLVVQLVALDGSTKDVTALAKFRVTDGARVALEGNVVSPLADGSTELTVEHASLSVRVPIDVKKAKADPPISFMLDVMPVFTKAGCNAGKCHGSARGQNGFRLSLFGYDPDGDFYRLLREQPGRQINLARADDCLLINKAVGKIAHVGGKRFDEDSPPHKTLLRWLEEGAPPDSASVARPISLEVLPRELVLAGAGEKHRITVLARYSDGTDRDVTPLALFLTNNDGIAVIGDDAMVTAVAPGAAFVMARFATFTQGTPVVVRPKNSKPNFPPDIKDNNYIDALVHARLKKLHIVPSDFCSDEVFLRRLYIDMIGLLPTKSERDKFLADNAPNKRERLVDELLARKEFSELWIMKWAELLQVRQINGMSGKGLQKYYDWLADRVHKNVPPNQLIKDLMSASGSTFTSPQANYFLTETEPTTLAENVAQVFLGCRIQCAQCHNHPFDRWTMDDYYGFTAFFGQVGYRPAQDPREIMIYNRTEGETLHPVHRRPVPPKFLGGATPDVKGKDYRTALGQWLGETDNPFFARHLANLTWSQYFGKGIVDPVDDVRISNPPSNPELLDALAKKLINYNYDVKKLIRDIATSRSYQLATKRNESNKNDVNHVASAHIRRVKAEVLLDCIAQVTEAPSVLPGLPPGSRAVHLVDGRVNNYFLQTFGRSNRDSACTCLVKVEPTLSQALHLLNGDTVNGRIGSGKVIRRQLAENKTPRAIIEDLYQRCLCRMPTPDELSRLGETLRPGATLEADLEDVFWALLNSKEFVFNH